MRRLSAIVVRIVLKEKGSLWETFLSLLPFIVFIASSAAWKLNSTIYQVFPLASVC